MEGASSTFNLSPDSGGRSLPPPDPGDPAWSNGFKVKTFCFNLSCIKPRLLREQQEGRGKTARLLIRVQPTENGKRKHSENLYLWKNIKKSLVLNANTMLSVVNIHRHIEGQRMWVDHNSVPRFWHVLTRVDASVSCTERWRVSTSALFHLLEIPHSIWSKTREYLFSCEGTLIWSEKLTALLISSWCWMKERFKGALERVGWENEWKGGNERSPGWALRPPLLGLRVLGSHGQHPGSWEWEWEQQQYYC